MSRLGQRLVAWLCVTAYLFANSHAALALSGFRLPAKPASSKQGALKSTSKCKHCTKKKSTAVCSTTVNSPSPGDKHPPCDGPFCPCDDHGAPTCPCPGGCAMCSVAKAPCLADSSVIAFAAPCLGETPCEEPVRELPLFGADLLRPPRV